MVSLTPLSNIQRLFKFILCYCLLNNESIFVGSSHTPAFYTIIFCRVESVCLVNELFKFILVHRTKGGATIIVLLYGVDHGVLVSASGTYEMKRNLMDIGMSDMLKHQKPPKNRRTKAAKRAAVLSSSKETQSKGSTMASNGKFCKCGSTKSHASCTQNSQRTRIAKRYAILCSSTETQSNGSTTASNGNGSTEAHPSSTKNSQRTSTQNSRGTTVAKRAAIFSSSMENQSNVSTIASNGKFCTKNSCVNLALKGNQKTKSAKRSPSSQPLLKEEEGDATIICTILPGSTTETQSKCSSTVCHGKCPKCGSKQTRIACTQNSCVRCCDDTTCQVHSKAKAQRNWKEQVLAGTTEIQILAKELRRRRLPPGRFRETRFLFSGDTLRLWDLRAICQNPKLKESILRKSRRREQTISNRKGEAHLPPKVGNSKQRFYRIAEALYQKSLQKEM